MEKKNSGRDAVRISVTIKRIELNEKDIDRKRESLKAVCERLLLKRDGS